MPVVWLVSYPKSGNTWLRALLTNYLRSPHAREGVGPASINALVGGPSIIRRDVVDELLGFDSAALTPGELHACLPRVHELLAGELPSPAFVKSHYAYRQLADGTPIFPPAATAGVVCIVRNPLDVAVSYAHHAQTSPDRIIDWMNDPAATSEGRRSRGIHTFLSQPIGTWSGHVSGWLDQRRLAVHLVRYEELLADPEAAFGAVVRFAGLDFDAERLARAVGHSTFARLRDQEAASGFREKQPTAPDFFRAGEAGAWRTSLDRGQVRKLLAVHGPVMERLGYRPTVSRDRPGSSHARQGSSPGP